MDALGTTSWADWIQAAGIIGGLLFTGISLRQTLRIERVRFHFDLAENHANIWKELFGNPELVRVLDPEVDLDQYPLTQAEEVFVRLLVLHLQCSLEAMGEGLLDSPLQLEKDVREFFQLPIPQAAWERCRPYQDSEVVALVNRLVEPLVLVEESEGKTASTEGGV